MNAGLAAVVVLSLLAVGDAAPGKPLLTPYSREVYVMGTRAGLTAYAGDRRDGLAHLERLLEVIDATEADLSTWRADSEISRLNAASGRGPRTLSAATCRLFGALDTLVAQTGRAFDPAIGALTQAWDLHGGGRIPGPRALARARAWSGWNRVSVDVPGCHVGLAPRTTLDVGAFGKGEALDRVRRLAGEGGPWLIDLGGQIAVSGPRPDGSDWPVTIAHPRLRAQPVVSLHLAGGSLATSAGSERDLLVGGQRVGHILDPRTGRPVAYGGSTSVWSASALTADALSTALHVMGPEEGLRWAEAHDVAVLFLDVDGGGTLTQRASRSFPRREIVPPDGW